MRVKRDLGLGGLITSVCAAFGLIAAGPLGGCGDRPQLDSMRMARSVVQVRTDRGRGTGFVARAGDRLVIVTAAHVVADVAELMVMKEQPLGDTRVARTIYPDVDVLAVDFERDLAVLRVPEAATGALAPLPIDVGRCETAAVGWGYPPTAFTATREQGLTKVVLTATHRIALDAFERIGGTERVLSRESVSGILFSPRLEPGNSGGPVVSRDGKVVGVVVMKSAAHEQGAAVCVEHLQPLLAAAAASPAAPTRAQATELVSTIATQFLPFAGHDDGSRPSRDFIHPAVIDGASSLFARFLAAHFTVAMLGGDPRPDAKVHALRRAFATTFAETLAHVEKHGAPCTSDPRGVDVTCLGQVAALPMSIALLKAELKGMTGILEVTAQAEPRQISQRPPEFEVPFLIRDAIRTESVRLRLRWDYGRLWLMPREAEASLAAAVGDALAAERAAAGRHADDAGERQRSRPPPARRRGDRGVAGREPIAGRGTFDVEW